MATTQAVPKKSTVICIANDFSFTPGFRNRSQGQFSGEEFREDILEGFFEANAPEAVTIDFDGTAGYPTSFLEEAFGGLVRKFGYENVVKKLNFISEEDDTIIADVEKYMKEAASGA
jgi:hypothetical protein